MDAEGTPAPSSNTLRNVLLAVAAVYVIASLYFIFETRSRLGSLEAAQQASAKEIQHRINQVDNNQKASSEALAARVGMTEQDLQQRISARTADLERQQRAAERRLAEEQKKTTGQLGAVSGEVATVKTELGGAKSDIASTRSDLEATKAKLERAIGDLGVQSGLIARTRDDLEELRRRGDRNIYEFTLQKGARPTPVSTVSLQLKKTDQKKSKFTMNVIADDKTIEKKDRNVAEPLQFYTGRSNLLYEVVVFKVDKSTVSGYLSTPKSVAAPVNK
jgi:chromosome segregation ATPase